MFKMMRRIFLMLLVAFLSVGLLLCSLNAINIAHAQPIIFSDNFQEGNLNAWTAWFGTLSLNSQVNIGSPYSVESVEGPNANTYENLYNHTLIGLAMNPMDFREYVYITSTTVPSTSGDYYEVGGFSGSAGGGYNTPNFGDGEICVFNLGGTLYWGVYYRDANSKWTGALAGFSFSISTDNKTSDAHPIQLGWNCLELKQDIGTSGQDELFLNGTAVLNVTVNNHDRGVPLDAIIGGSQTIANQNNVWNYYIDDVIVSSGYIGTLPYKLTTSTNYGTISPASGMYDSGSIVTVTATPPAATSGEQYAWQGWTGTGAGSYTGPGTPSGSSYTALVTMYGNVTETASWVLQYYLTVTSTYDSASPSSGWFDSGSSITASVASPVSGGSGTQYACTGWSGTGSVLASGSASAVTFTISVPSTITWNWETQYFLTVTSAYGTPGGGGWYNSGASAYATVTPLTVAGPSGTQYVFIGWTGDASGGTSPSNAIIMSGPKTATANWETQYYLTVSSSYGGPTGQGWYNAGSSASFSVTTPASGGTGIQYVFISWSGLGIGSYSGAGSSQSVTMNNAITETANWQTQYQVTFTQSGVGSDFSGNVMTVNGTAYKSAGFTVWANPGVVYTFSYSSPLVVTANGERYVLTGVTGNATASSLTVSEAATVTGAYKTQYYFAVASAYGSPSPSSGWFDSGSAIQAYVGSPISVSAGEQYVCSGWSGTGSVTASGTTSATTLTISAPSTITWNWETQYFLTVTSAYGTPGGGGWYNSGASAYATVSPLTLTITNGATAAFTGWSGDASGTTSPSSAIIMNGPETASASWTVSTPPNTTPTPKPTKSASPSPSPIPTSSPSPTTSPSASPSRSPSAASNIGTYAIIGIVVAVILVVVIGTVLFLNRKHKP